MPFLHSTRDTVVRDEAWTMLYEEELMDKSSGRDIWHNHNATTAYGTKAERAATSRKQEGIQ
jgi:hypothetical protein